MSNSYLDKTGLTYFWGKLKDKFQEKLSSGTNIKTVNNNSLLGSGNVAVQPTLVSGTNIKTINGNSLLGSGDITISAGGVEHLYQHNLVISTTTYRIAFSIFSTSATAITKTTLKDYLGTTSATKIRVVASGYYIKATSKHFVISYIEGSDSTNCTIFGEQIEVGSTSTVTTNDYEMAYSGMTVSDKVTTLW